MDTIVYSLVQSQRATAVVVTECEWGKTEHALFCSVFTMCDSTKQNGLVSSIWHRAQTSLWNWRRAKIKKCTGSSCQDNRVTKNFLTAADKSQIWKFSPNNLQILHELFAALHFRFRLVRFRFRLVRFRFSLRFRFQFWIRILATKCRASGMVNRQITPNKKQGDFRKCFKKVYFSVTTGCWYSDCGNKSGLQMVWISNVNWNPEKRLVFE